MNDTLGAALEHVGDDDAKLRHLVEELERVQGEVSAAETARNEARNRREEIEREVESLRSQADRAEKEAERDVLVPGTNPSAVKSRVRSQVEEMLERADELESELAHREQSVREAKEERSKVAGRLARRLGRHARRALHAVVESWALLATAERPVTEVFRDTVLPAEKRWGVMLAALRHAASQAGVGFSQKKRLRSYLTEVELGPEAALGFLLRETLDWSRLDKSPAADLWRDLDVSRAAGSILNRRPVPALEDTLRRLQNGSLPWDIRI